MRAIKCFTSAVVVISLALAALGPRAAEASDWPIPPWGTGESRAEDIRVTLITFGPGDEIASWFGHSAVLVQDTRRRAARVYNYGMFSFGPDLLPKFLMGRLEFWVGEATLSGTLHGYSIADRDIRFQELNLSPELRMRLAKALADNVLPENRYYMYHHYDDNCATRIRDIVDEVLGGQMREYASKPGRMTLREHTRRHSQHNPLLDLILMLWMNDEIDRPITVWEEMFLPGEMERVFAELRYVDEAGVERPLVLRTETRNRAEGRAEVPQEPSRVWPLLLLIGVAAGGAPIALARWHGRSGKRLPRVLLGLHNVLIGLVVGLPATVLFLMWTITEHTVTYRNENLLLANPLTFLAVPLGIGVVAGSRKATCWLSAAWLLLAATSLLAVLVKPLPWFAQDNWMIIALLLPMNLGLAAYCWWIPGVRPALPYFSSSTKEPSQSSSGGEPVRKRQRAKRSSAGR